MRKRAVYYPVEANLFDRWTILLILMPILIRLTFLNPRGERAEGVYLSLTASRVYFEVCWPSISLERGIAGDENVIACYIAILNDSPSRWERTKFFAESRASLIYVSWEPRYYIYYTSPGLPPLNACNNNFFSPSIINTILLKKG